MKISVVTINFNNADGLRKTVESVVCQTYHEFEYIIVDGASTDGGAEYVREIGQKNYPFALQWVSEKDSGIYNAMNKGVRMAQGEYVLMLNSGDYLVNKYVLEHIIAELGEIDIVQGNTITEEDGMLRRNRGYGKSNITYLDVQRGYFLHQAAFCKRMLFDKFGYFNENYRYVSDTEFFIKALGNGGASFRYVDIDVANFDKNGFSSSKDPQIIQAYRAEEYAMQHELFPGRLYAFCRDVERKVELYDTLHEHRWMWNILVFLKVLNRFIYGDKRIPVSDPIK